MHPLLPPLALLLSFAALVVFLSSQLSKPSGWFGRMFMGSMLNQFNRSLLDAAVRALDPKPGERILDVGFGGGYSLEQIAAATKPARATGVEISQVMIDEANRRWNGVIEVQRGDVTALPFPDASFDGVLSVNTIYFWSDATAALRELSRVLKPSGRLVLAGRGKAFMRLSPVTWFGFRLYSAAQLTALLASARLDATFVHPSRAEWIVISRPSNRTA